MAILVTSNFTADFSASTADFISRHLLILGDDPDHYVYIFAGAIGLGAPVHLGVDEIPIIVAHHRTAQHYTGTRTIDRPWSVPESMSFVNRMRVQHISWSLRVQL